MYSSITLKNDFLKVKLPWIERRKKAKETVGSLNVTMSQSGGYNKPVGLSMYCSLYTCPPVGVLCTLVPALLNECLPHLKEESWGTNDDIGLVIVKVIVKLQINFSGYLCGKHMTPIRMLLSFQKLAEIYTKWMSPDFLLAVN